MPGVAVFLHDHGDQAGYLEPYLGSEPDDHVMLEWRRQESRPRAEIMRYLNDYEALIFLGGSMSAHHPHLASELLLVEEALKARKPLLGICLGAQMLAKALGAKVHRNRSKEIGWSTVCLTPEAGSDPLFEGLAPKHTVFQWHNDSFDLPDRAVHLASSEACPYQAFRWSDHAWGLQFHLEATPAIIRSWADSDALLRSVLGEPNEPNLDNAELAQHVFGRWTRRFPGSL